MERIVRICFAERFLQLPGERLGAENGQLYEVLDSRFLFSSCLVQILNYKRSPKDHDHKSTALESHQNSKLVDNQVANSEQEKQCQTYLPISSNGEGKGHSDSTRSCTKVHKQGIALGRSVDLANFNNYNELVAALDDLFKCNGELTSQNKNWLVVYTDDEDDMMLVGDDPWDEFCRMVRKILICTKEEVQHMNPGTFISNGEQYSSVPEGLDANEARDLPHPSTSSPDDC
ncbi:auxin response factor 2A-like [Olea europaea var. sylvestris]|uniref:auxin response factor 2A-like n=1 Tax=Olea europaea var. sylvestris TaxID=158386 RepID=UPI000C1D8CB9|nr:auxin response factor 2A-like [Olea europaea var. sylvestris]